MRIRWVRVAVLLVVIIMISGCHKTSSTPVTTTSSTGELTTSTPSTSTTGSLPTTSTSINAGSLPPTPVVIDDGQYTRSTDTLHASWNSPEKGLVISEYQYAVGMSSGGTDIVNWTSTGTETQVVVTGLSLKNGKTYYISVKSRNEAGKWSDSGTSDGIKIDTGISRGDANGDGKTDLGDVLRVERIMLGLDTSTLAADANSDGVIDDKDVLEIESIMTGGK